MTSPVHVGSRVRTLRLASNISQTELARELTSGSTGNTLVSKVESGRQRLDDDLLEALAGALGATIEFLTRGPLEPDVSRPWLRAYADASSKAVDSLLADNVLAHEAISVLGLDRIPDSLPIFDGDLNDDHAIERFAEDVRIAAGIEEGAIVGNAMRAADRLGCVVVPMRAELGRHLGLSHRIDDVPFVRVSRPGTNGFGVPGDRQRFTVAHEIGHLGLHTGCRPPETADEARHVERQAHRFASAFLVPAEPLLDHWRSLGGRVTLSTLSDLKASWGISIKALVVRFQQLGIISSDQATSLYKQISKRGWNKKEPVSTTTEEPLWFASAAMRAFGGKSRNALVAAASDEMGLSETFFKEWLDWSPVTAPADVSILSPRTDPSVLQPAPGVLIRFPRSR